MKIIPTECSQMLMISGTMNLQKFYLYLTHAKRPHFYLSSTILAVVLLFHMVLKDDFC